METPFCPECGSASAWHNYSTRPVVANPERVEVGKLEMIRHANEALVCWLRDNPGWSIPAGIAACAAGAGLIMVAPTIMAMGVGVVAFGSSVMTMGGVLGAGGVLLGCVGRSAEAISAALRIGTYTVLGGGAIAGAGVALQAAGIIAATGGGALIAGGVVASGYGAYRMIRGRHTRATRDLLPQAQQQLREAGHNPEQAPAVVFDLSSVRNPL